jgi:hypothetical protein
MAKHHVGERALYLDAEQDFEGETARVEPSLIL